MSDINFLFGYPVEFKNLCMVYPPKVRDTFNNKFHMYAQILTISQEEIEDEYVEKKMDISQLLTPFEYLLNAAYIFGHIQNMPLQILTLVPGL